MPLLFCIGVAEKFMFCCNNIFGTTPAFPFTQTKVWNRSGVEPAGVSELQRAEVAPLGVVVWPRRYLVADQSKGSQGVRCAIGTPRLH